MVYRLPCYRFSVMDVEEAGADAAAIPVIPSAGALSDDDMEYEFDSSLSDASSGRCIIW